MFGLGLLRTEAVFSMRQAGFTCGLTACAVVLNTEEDIARYTVAAIGDECAINKSLHIRPKLNTLTQHDLVRASCCCAAWVPGSACLVENSAHPWESEAVRHVWFAIHFHHLYLFK